MKHFRINSEGVLAAVAFGLSAVVTWHIVALNMMRALVDENSHLNLARQMVDSITPGLSQIGFWPPLLHILMAPAASYDPFYRSGLAGYVILAPAFVIGTLYLYRICYLLTKNQYVSFWGALLYVTSPFILYYTATPMMEVLFLTFLFGAAYYMVLWFHDNTLRSLIFAGIFISCATMSRFEGIFVIPIALILVGAQLFRKQVSYHTMEAVGILFGIVSILGFGFILGYGYIYGGNLFAFSSSQWSAFNQQRDYLLPTQHNLLNSLIYLVHASYHVIGQPIIIISLVLFVLLILFGLFGELGRKKYAGVLGVIGVLSILAAPFIFDIFALYRGNAIIYIPELYPYGVYFNERYGLYWIGFVIVVIVLGISIFQKMIKEVRFGEFINTFLLSLFMSFLLIWNIGWLWNQAFVENYRTVKDSAQGYPSHDQAEVANYLREHYDWGKVLMTRALHDFIAVEAHLPLIDYVQESNYKYFDQVLERPWLFARYVVMYNPGSSINGNWAKFNEKISARYGNSDEFKKYYKLVVQNERERLYVLKPEAVVEYAALHDYSIYSIPSLNQSIKIWNPDTIYTQMSSSSFQIKEVKPELMSDNLLISSQYMNFYQTQLKPLYKNGYYVDSEGGSSTYQAYALFQAYLARDPKTFDTIWQFTRNNLQHTTDNLFASRFIIDSRSSVVKITQNELQTGADSEIAYALYRAGALWKDSTYIREADLIIADIWEKQVSQVQGKYVISSGKKVDGGKIDIRVSSFTPFAYREFARHDIAHDWTQLAADSYELLKRIAGWELHKNTSVYLPVEEAVLTKSDNKIDLPEGKYYSDNFAGDTPVVFFNIALDAVLNTNKAAKNYIYITSFFDEQWKKGNVCSIVTFEEKEFTCAYDMASLIAPLSVWKIKNPELADELISKYYIKNQSLTINQNASFSEKSLFWFGLVLWNGNFR